MHTQFRISAIVAVKRFKHRGPPRPIDHPWGCVGKAVGDRLIGVTHHARIAKQPPCQGDGIGIWQRIQQRGQGAIAHMDIHKLVDIQRHHPIGLGKNRQGCGPFIGAKLHPCL